jgi:hypothetical protein
VDVEELVKSKAIFYGVRLDKDDPFTERNLARLEMRFKERYESSLEKEKKRKGEGKPPHKTVLKSIEDNWVKLEAVRRMRQFWVGD